MSPYITPAVDVEIANSPRVNRHSNPLPRYVRHGNPRFFARAQRHYLSPANRAAT